MLLISLAVLLVGLSLVARFIPDHSAASPVDDGSAEGVVRELNRLDEFSFIVVPGDEYGTDHIVVGPTGAHAIRIAQRTVDENYRRDLRRARRASKRVCRELGPASVHTSVYPVLCMPGRQFPPKSRRSVRVVPWTMVIQAISEGHGDTLTPHQVKRVVEELAGEEAAAGLAG
jgi:hypothetical protein